MEILTLTYVSGVQLCWDFLLYADLRNSKSASMRFILFQRGPSPKHDSLVAKPKNDPGGLGVSRTSVETTNLLCLVRAYSQWMLRCDWGPSEECEVSPPNIRNLVESLLKFDVLSNNIPMAEISTHSLRSGGATNLFHFGVDMGTIQKWGGWNSQCFTLYFVRRQGNA